ncbi:hypothetical protein C2L65_42915 [Paraburkholderia terrae]|uniref:Uncharacterized protein n=1 Tax=Paraburkholderia terrae TaxID=311230 RepID=A0A2I8F4G8_9BURK|nr:hypothetical protein C2L65_42915 [Paraburkholderia terrae]
MNRRPAFARYGVNKRRADGLQNRRRSSESPSDAGRLVFDLDHDGRTVTVTQESSDVWAGCLKLALAHTAMTSIKPAALFADIWRIN